MYKNLVDRTTDNVDSNIVKKLYEYVSNDRTTTTTIAKKLISKTELVRSQQQAVFIISSALDFS